ncbi:unnamed protein product [Heligmosomoides polygyrus]|uniref:DUF126 domain-containing protein n=1 Tax=Heligmosomoides polygyrus TaxID=6339 RepID=A0A183FVJ4_HELPZ|nr:unnamed protein product [Heligmosomoides polygyrus]
MAKDTSNVDFTLAFSDIDYPRTEVPDRKKATSITPGLMFQGACMTSTENRHGRRRVRHVHGIATHGCRRVCDVYGSPCTVADVFGTSTASSGMLADVFGTSTASPGT